MFMTELVCPSCAHSLFTLEEDHAHCAKCQTIVRFAEVRRHIIVQMGWDKSDILRLFEDELSNLLEEIEEKNDKTAEISDG